MCRGENAKRTADGMVAHAIDRDIFEPEQLAGFWRFICERQAIWHRRVVERRPPPWTIDRILRCERFTNVYRELDPGTRYAVERILEADAPMPDRVFNLMLYRLIGRAETHAVLGFQWLDDFELARLEAALKSIRASGRPPFTAAYTVSGYRSMGSRDKCENVARLFARLHASFDTFIDRLEAAPDPRKAHQVLASAYGFGNFLAFQVLVDLTYPLPRAGERSVLPFSQDAWASAGPGARRGIATLTGCATGIDRLAVMRWLRDHQRDEVSRLGLTFLGRDDESGAPVPLTLANIQNCLCEFHKYVKIRDGTGRGRRRFTPRPLDASDGSAVAGYGSRGVM